MEYYNRYSTPPSIGKVIQRYNESVSDITEYKHYKIVDNNVQADKALRHAGESMSECLEFALKRHCYDVDKDNYYSFCYNSSIPKIIENFYWDDDCKKVIAIGEDTLDGIVPTVDFSFLKSQKFKLINGAKHQGKDVDIHIFNRYQIEVRNFILQYLDCEADLKSESYFNQPQFDILQQFYSACEKFRYEERRFILLSDKIKESNIFYRNIGRVRWDVIIDFNNKSMEEGLCFYAYSGNTPSHILKSSDLMTDDSIPTYSDSPIIYFADGFRNEPNSNTFKDWNKNKYRKVDSFINEYSKITCAQEIIVVSIMMDKNRLSSMIEIIERHFDNVRFVVANDNENLIADFCENNVYKEDIDHVSISMSQIDSCLNECLPEIVKVDRSLSFKLPCLSKEVDGIVSKEKMALFEEYFEVLYEGIDEGTDENETIFLSGETKLSWEGARRRFAAERSRMRQLYLKTMDAEIRKGRSRIMIVHEPGFGGSTLARQIAYNYKDDYPVLIMKRYNFFKVRDLLTLVHSLTKKTILIFMEIPSVISMEDMNNLIDKTNRSRPYIFVGIRRGRYKPGTDNLYVTDWGNDTVILRDKFLPHLKRLPADIRKEKEAEMNRIVSGYNIEPYMRTPFYFGWLTYAENFKAMDSYLEHFVSALKGNEAQRKALIYICIMNEYAERGLPDSFLRIVFNVEQKEDIIFHLQDYFSEDDDVLNSLLRSEYKDGTYYRSLKYPYFGKHLLTMLLNNNISCNSNELINLGSYCKQLIDDVAHSVNNEFLQEYVLKNIFIGSSKERIGEKFTKIIRDIQKEEKVNIFKLLHDSFPMNPHFASHLARYYAMDEKNIDLGLQYAEKAIQLSPTDPLLHHIKAMCLLSQLTEKANKIVENMNKGKQPSNDEVNEIIENIFPEAQSEFALSREYYYEKQEHGYIPNIKLLLRVFDFYVAVNKKSKMSVVAEAISPYIDWLEEAQSLLEEVRTLYIEGEESSYYNDVEVRTWKEYENFGELINRLNNKLDKTISNKPLVRRQLARIYMHRDDNYKKIKKDNNRILQLMEQNILDEPQNDRNFYLWFSAARYSLLKLDELVAKTSQWRGRNPSIKITFYCYVLNVLKALDGSTENATIAMNLEKEMKRMSDGDIRVREWCCNCPQRLMTNKDFKEANDISILLIFDGYVSKYIHSGAAEITEQKSGMTVFFRPSENKLIDNCLNHKVEFSFGFSYDGLRAYDGSVNITD